MSLTKATKAEFKLYKDANDQPTGEVEFYASVFGNVDLTGDRVVKGAFADSLEAWRKSGDPIPVIFSHDWSNPFSMIGSADPNDVVEDDIGLKVKAQLDINENPTAMQVFKNMSRKTLNQSSFAYDVVRESGLKKGIDGANDLLQLDLIEVGPTLLGANPATAGVLSAKSRTAGKKDAPLEGSLEANQQAVLQAVTCYFGSMPGADSDDFYVSPYATYPDHIIVSVADFSDGYSTRYFNFPTELDDQGEVQLGTPTEVEVTTTTQVSIDGKSTDPDGAKASAAAGSAGDDDRAQTLFDLSDKQHTQIAVGIVFGAADVRDGNPKPQSDWSYRGGNPGADLSSGEVATVVSRVRAAAEKFDIDLNSGGGSKTAPTPETKTGARHSQADLASIQAIHDKACALGASCSSKSAGASGTKDAPGDQSEGEDNEQPEDASTDDEGDEDDGDGTPGDAGGDADDTEDSSSSGDEADSEEDDEEKSSRPSAAKDYSLDLLELESFTL
jgi:HK97 family phage prohead protease